MNTLSDMPAPHFARPARRHGFATGTALIAIGLLALAAEFGQVGFGRLVLPALGAIFLLWGLVTRNAGLLIPGGILSGIGLGVWLNAYAFNGLESTATAAVFTLSFAAGWALITVLSLAIGRLVLWPLIPGGILAAAGLALLSGGPALDLVTLAGRLWPVLLIALGLYVLVARQGTRSA